jgi:diguanylate cyclase (GGDEF)-like protein/hemerythrin-like metal-binding protein/PAS domain S-box-containing protein
LKTFIWNQSYVTGLETVDEQHQYLVDLINHFGEQVSTGQAPDADALRATFNSLAEYAVFHFGEEERLMVSAGIDARHFESHRAEHRRFLNDVTEIRKNSARGGSDADDSLLSFLVHWLTYHILGYDQLMARQVKLIETGMSAAEAFQQVSVVPDGGETIAALLQSVNGLIKEVRQRNADLISFNRSLKDEVRSRTLDLEQKLESEKELTTKLEQSHRNLLKSRSEVIERERRFRDFASVASDWFWEMDENLRFTYFSERLKEATGFDPNSLIGKSRKEIGIDDIEFANWGEHLKTLDKREPFRDFMYSTKHEGETVWMSASGVPIFDDEGQFVGYRGTGTNITPQKNREHELQENDRKLRFLIDQYVDGILVVDDSKKVRFANPAANLVFCRDTNDLVGEYLNFSFDRQDQTQEVEIDTAKKKLIAEVRSVHTEWEGENAWLISLRDITQRKKDELEIRRLNKDNELILSSTSEGLIGVDSEGIITFANQSAERILGWSISELLGKSEHELLHHTRSDGSSFPAEDCQLFATIRDGEMRSSDDGIFWTRSGMSIPVQVTSSPIMDDGKVAGAVVAFQDITERKRAYEEIRRLATTDSLTDLANRSHFNQTFERSLLLAHREKKKLAVMLLDLDKFKPVNDTYGHPVGDILLQKVSTIFKEHSRTTDILGRFGGDEFAIVLVHPESTKIVETVAERILSEVCKPIFISGNHIEIGVSIGVSMYPNDGLDIKSLISAADRALYQAKSQGRNCYRFHISKGSNDAGGYFRYT